MLMKHYNKRKIFVVVVETNKRLYTVQYTTVQLNIKKYEEESRKTIKLKVIFLHLKIVPLEICTLFFLMNQEDHDWVSFFEYPNEIKPNTIFNCFIEGGSIRKKMEFENLGIATSKETKIDTENTRK